MAVLGLTSVPWFASSTSSSHWRTNWIAAGAKDSCPPVTSQFRLSAFIQNGLVSSTAHCAGENVKVRGPIGSRLPSSGVPPNEYHNCDDVRRFVGEVLMLKPGGNCNRIPAASPPLVERCVLVR